MQERVCVSFDYENDRKYYYIMKAWNSNKNIAFCFDDCTPAEIQSESISKIKEVLTKKICSSNYLFVIVGEESSAQHTDHKKIGYENWQNFEIAKAKEFGKKIVAIKINKQYESPRELLGSGVSWVMSFTEEAIEEGLRNAY